MSGGYGILPFILLNLSQKGCDELVLWLISWTYVVCFVGAWVAHLYSHSINQMHLLLDERCLECRWLIQKLPFLQTALFISLKLTSKMNYLHCYTKMWTISPIYFANVKQYKIGFKKIVYIMSDFVLASLTEEVKS